MLTKNAFNALLKTLEEPPPHVVFIFATTEVQQGAAHHPVARATLRLQAHLGAAYPRAAGIHLRPEGIKAEREALEAVARKGDGSMRDALSLFDQVYAYAGADFTLEAARKVLGLPRESLCDGLIRALVQHDQKACFGALQDAQNEGIEIQDFLIAFGEYLRNMLFARQGVSPAALGLSEARYAELAAIAPGIARRRHHPFRQVGLRHPGLAQDRGPSAPGGRTGPGPHGRPGSRGDIVPGVGRDACIPAGDPPGGRYGARATRHPQRR